MEDKKLFIVDFEAKRRSRRVFGILGEESDSIYVIARDYNEAANKATVYAESRSKEPKNILTSDGSLNLEEAEGGIPQVVGVRLAGEEIIW